VVGIHNATCPLLICKSLVLATMCQIMRHLPWIQLQARAASIPLWIQPQLLASSQPWFGWRTTSQPIKMVFTCIPSCCLEWKALNCTSPPTVHSMGDARVMLLNHFVGTGGMERVEESGHRVALCQSVICRVFWDASVPPFTEKQQCTMVS
jgi:hypothetical protein